MKFSEFCYSQMRSQTFLSACLIALLVVASGCNRSRERDRQYIENSERQWAESVATNDSSVLERILDDDFVVDLSRWNKDEQGTGDCGRP
jgi:hypothetical protein